MSHCESIRQSHIYIESIHNRPAGKTVLQKVTHSRQLSPSVPLASQGAIQKESKSTSSDTTECKCSSGSHTEAVARIACSNHFMTGISSCRLSTRGFPRTGMLYQFWGLVPLPQIHPPVLRLELHEPTGLACPSKSARFNPLGDTAGQRSDQPHPRRPSPKKRPGNLQPATGRTDTHAVSDSTIGRSDTHAVSTLPRPGGMHQQPPPS